MKAWRNLGGNVIEVDVDQDPTGAPILPPDTTTANKPAEIEGQYLTVVGKNWVHIPITVAVVSFESKKQQALEALKKYTTWNLDQPVDYLGFKFDGDEQARNRLIQALVINQANGYLPPAWVTFDNSSFTISTIDDLKGIINSVQTAFGTRYFEGNDIRARIMASTTEAELTSIEIPSIPNAI